MHGLKTILIPNQYASFVILDIKHSKRGIIEIFKKQLRKGARFMIWTLLKMEFVTIQMKTA